MGEFFNAAFPWVAFSIGLALVLTHMNLKKKEQDNTKQ